MFKRCRDAGINFFDCANSYGKGKSEEILGRLISDCRDEVVITSKVTQRTGKDINSLGSSRRHIMLEVEKSLKRLQDRPDRPVLYSPLRSPDPHRRKPARPRRPGAPGQSNLYRGQQLGGLANRQGVGDLRRRKPGPF